MSLSAAPTALARAGDGGGDTRCSHALAGADGGAGRSHCACARRRRAGRAVRGPAPRCYDQLSPRGGDAVCSARCPLGGEGVRSDGCPRPFANSPQQAGGGGGWRGQQEPPASRSVQRLRRRRGCGPDGGRCGRAGGGVTALPPPSLCQANEFRVRCGTNLKSHLVSFWI